MADLIQSTVVLVLAIALVVLWNQVSHKPWGRSPRRNGNRNGSDKRNPFISSAQPAQGMTSNTTKSSNVLTGSSVVSTHCLFGKTGLPIPKALSHPTSHRQAHAAMG